MRNSTSWTRTSCGFHCHPRNHCCWYTHWEKLWLLHSQYTLSLSLHTPHHTTPCTNIISNRGTHHQRKSCWWVCGRGRWWAPCRLRPNSPAPHSDSLLGGLRCILKGRRGEGRRSGWGEVIYSIIKRSLNRLQTTSTLNESYWSVSRWYGKRVLYRLCMTHLLIDDELASWPPSR